MSMTYYFYILYSRDRNAYYIGHTGNLQQRIQKHKTNHKGYTGKTGDWELIYVEVYSSKKEAYKRERVVKSWKSRKRIEELVQ
ncbi:MAG: GIY-YIG nuclease family protein, partial [Bacteroidales bacterium]